MVGRWLGRRDCEIRDGLTLFQIKQEMLKSLLAELKDAEFQPAAAQ